jgi:hypothetical protein
MDTFELQDFNKRIGLNTDLKNISEQICSQYNLGGFISNELITIGYEDYNYYLTTTKGKYCVKIFNNIRTRQDIVNYLERIRVVANSQINAPKPLKINNDIVLELDYKKNHYDICVFEYIDGKNYFELNQKANKEIIKELAKQTAMINQLDIKPDFIYDSMNNYFIIHGSFGNSFVNWFPYLRKEIEKKELEVYTPDFPTGVCKI